MSTGTPRDASELLDRLEAVNREHAEASEADRLPHLEAALAAAVRDLSEDERKDMIRAARDRLVDDAGLRASRARELEAELVRLREENAALRSGGGAHPRAGGDGAAAALRAALDGAAGAAPAERLLGLLVGFAIDADRALRTFLAELGAGPYARMNTVMIDRSLKGLADAMRSCVSGGEGFEQVESDLEQARRLLAGMHAAHAECLPRAVAHVLDELSPDVILEQHAGKLGADHAKAWKTLRQRHADLSERSPKETWERLAKDDLKSAIEAMLG